MRTADPRDALVNAMLPFATELACQVHDWNAAAVAEILRPLDEQGKDALIVALAALVPVGQPLRDLIAWSHDTKPCADCGERKLLTDFHRDSTSPDGRHSYCRACRTETRRKSPLQEVACGEQRRAS